MRLTRPKHNTQNQYIKNYEFDYNFGPPWGSCSVTMTCVSGHMTAMEFPPDFKDWNYPPPESLFDATVQTIVPDVGIPSLASVAARWPSSVTNTEPRTRRPSPRT